MWSKFLKCIKDTESINSKDLKTSNGKTMLLSMFLSVQCAIVKNQYSSMNMKKIGY